MELKGVAAILTNREISLIAGAAGISGMFGILEDDMDIEKIDVYNTLNNLVQKGCLKNDGTKFIPDSIIDKCIQNIKSADYVSVIYPPNDSLPIKCCYINDNTAVINEPCAAGKNLYKLYTVKMNELTMLLYNEKYLPDEKNDAAEYTGEHMFFTETLDMKPYTYPADLVIDIYIDSKITERIIVRNNKIIHVGDSCQSMKYTIDNMKKMLEERENNDTD